MSLYNNYFYPTFNYVFPSLDDFKKYYMTCGIPHLIDDKIDTVYLLLRAQYGETPHSFTSDRMFKDNVMAIIYEYGPTWSKRVDIQERLRNLTEDEIRTGGTTMNNYAKNPSTPVVQMNPEDESTPIVSGTLTNKELGYLTDQNTNLTLKSIMSGYSNLLELLETDVTKPFIDRFNKLFCFCVADQQQPMYIIPEE